MSRKDGKFQARRIDEKRFELDVRGLTCPYPQLIVTRTLNSLCSDDILEVILDNPPSARDIPPVLEAMGHKISRVSRPDGSTWKIVVQTKNQ